jgi:hypothetical protein
VEIFHAAKEKKRYTCFPHDVHARRHQGNHRTHGSAVRKN